MIWDNFLFLEQIAPSPAGGTRSYMLRGFLRMSRKGNDVRNSLNRLCFWPTTQRVYVVGILFKYFRRKLLQFE